MNKPVLLLLLVLLLPVKALAIDLPFIGGGDKNDAEAKEEKEKEKTKFVVHFKNGGSLETDNYTVTKDNVVVMMESGAIYLDRKMVTSIEEVAGPEEESVQTIQVGTPAKPAPAKKTEKPSTEVEVPLPEEIDTTPRDDEGHSEAWWHERVQKWKDKKADAEQRLAEAQDNWNRYNGQYNNLDPDAPDYERTRILDLRGSARVSMDRARADVEESDKMLNDVLPDEARKAGAPPGWVR